MTIGAIIAGIGIIYSFIQWISEQQQKKPDAKPSFQQQIRQAMEQNRLNVQSATEKNQQHLEQLKTQATEKVSRSTAQPAAEKQAKKISEQEKILSDTHLSERQKAQRLSMMQGDLTAADEVTLQFDRDNIVEGLIMAEILNPPKARR